MTITKTILSYKIFLTIVLSGLHLLNAQEYQESYAWKYDIKSGGSVSLTNYKCDIEIGQSANNSIDFELHVEANGGSEEDSEILDTYLKELAFKASASKVDLYANFFNRTTINSTTTIKLKNGKELGFENITVKAYLNIPSNIHFELNTRYSSISIPKIASLKLNSYKDNITGHNIAGDIKINARYSKLKFDALSDCNFELYNCNLNSSSTGNVKMDSRYSECTFGNVNDLNLKCYNDKLKFINTGNISFDGRYTEIVSNLTQQLKIKSYKCEFRMNSISSAKIESSRYSDYKIAAIDELEIFESNTDELNINYIEKLSSTDSRYSNYTIKEITSDFKILDGYKNKILIIELKSTSCNIDLNGRYGFLKIAYPSEYSIHLDFMSRYGKIDYDSKNFEIEHEINESSRLSLIATRYSQSAETLNIKIRGYKMELKISDL